MPRDDPASATVALSGHPILFYDGVCGLCNRLNRFVLTRDRSGRFRFAALQSRFANETLPRYGKDPEDLDTLYLITDYGTSSERLFWKARAVVRVLQELGGPWRLAGLLKILPTAALNAVYDAVAKRRYRIFGRSEKCLIPAAEHRSRFIELD